MRHRLLTFPGAALALAVSASAAALAPPGPALGPSLVLGEAGPGGPAVAASGSVVLVAWTGAGPDAGEILIRRSDDGGRSFGPAAAVSGTDRPSLNPTLAADGERFYVAWLEQEPDGNSLLLRASDDGGLTFGPAVSLAGPELAGPSAALAAAGGLVHAAWEHGDDETGEVLVRSSGDGGRSFGAAQAVNVGHAYGEPHVAAAGTAVWVSWDDFAANDGSDVFLATSADGGASFDGPRRLAEDLDRNSRHAVLAVADRLSVAWEDCPALAAGGCEIRLRQGAAAGPDLGEALVVTGDAVLPAAAAAGNFLHLLAVYRAPAGHALALLSSRNSGSTFAAPRLLGPVDPGPLPAIAATAAGFAAAWTDGTHVRFVRGGDPAVRPLELRDPAPLRVRPEPRLPR
jgi:hypothetical protein